MSHVYQEQKIYKATFTSEYEHFFAHSDPSSNSEDKPVIKRIPTEVYRTKRFHPRNVQEKESSTFPDQSRIGGTVPAVGRFPEFFLVHPSSERRQIQSLGKNARIRIYEVLQGRHITIYDAYYHRQLLVSIKPLCYYESPMAKQIYSLVPEQEYEPPISPIPHPSNQADSLESLSDQIDRKYERLGEIIDSEGGLSYEINKEALMIRKDLEDLREKEKQQILQFAGRFLPSLREYSKLHEEIQRLGKEYADSASSHLSTQETDRSEA